MFTLKAVFILFMVFLDRGLCDSYNDSHTLRGDLLANYDVNIRPVDNQSLPVNVAVQAFMANIRDFDEIREKIAYIGAIHISWHDFNMVWDPAKYGGIRDIVVPFGSVWTPPFVLRTPAEDVDVLIKKWSKIRFYSDGTASLMPLVLIESTCSVDVRMYPFDIQTCRASFVALNYNEFEVVLYPTSEEIDLTLYQENLLWKLRDTEVIQTKIGVMSSVDFILTLERKPSFVIINVILPIIFLNVLNVMVFLLIPESGERVSFAITVLLSIAVFMTIVSDMLPRSSDPVPLISYKLMGDMILSSLIVVVTVFNLKWYHTEDTVPVPAWLHSVHRVLTCSGLKPLNFIAPSNNIVNVKPENQNENRLDSVSPVVLDDDNGTAEVGNLQLVNDGYKTKLVTWRMISRLADRIALFMFLAASICNAIVFLVVTGAGVS